MSLHGKFITLEGTEGAGKSTNLKYIEAWLAQKGIELVVTREPGGTPISEAVRGILLNTEFTEMTANTELLLMFAARNQHIEEKILPALQAGKWVVSDRFTDASYAYQGAARGLEFDRIASLEHWVQQGFQPDLTFVFDLPIEVGMQRVKARGGQTDRFEQEKADFFEKVRDAYLQRAALAPQRYAVLNAAKTLEEVQAEIDTHLLTLLQHQG
ncbi:dTMP kinase [Thiosulfativibrio zosterae]|uniref:Thymidylate kinase n=1 Tax=Thiosulfativibrio zosterae TaxID=2675053 RepID=A0A6F8PNY0_9GAMM|nr:dTMP kinase [Thiosulfativibrio zosterae]BBP43805.1 thymidylate kinase [Thiosulfativibrio zosterae]